MKKQVYINLAIATLLVAAFSSVQAQSDRLITANVPFNFIIKDRALPAGEYVFALVQVGGSDAVKIQSADGHITAFVPARSARTKGSHQEPKLIFNRYADEYFLSSVYGIEESSFQNLATPINEWRLSKASTERTNVSIKARKQ